MCDDNVTYTLYSTYEHNAHAVNKRTENDVILRDIRDLFGSDQENQFYQIQYNSLIPVSYTLAISLIGRQNRREKQCNRILYIVGR